MGERAGSAVLEVAPSWAALVCVASQVLTFCSLFSFVYL
jgi:hypothetical protein